jgi:hypothetical protein
VSGIAAARGLTYLGLDVHRDTISVAVVGPGHQAPTVDRIANDEPPVRRLVARFPHPGRLRACYEAGPTGYDLARLLDRVGVHCQVITPALIPKAPGDKIKTDSRDCRRLARLHRAGELVAIRVPTVAGEAVRNLCRARADMSADRTRARHRLSKSCCATAGCSGPGRPGPVPMSGGCLASVSTTRRCRRPTPTIGRPCKPGMPPWTRSRPTWPAGMTGRRSLMPWPAWPPTGA